ncbi:piggyBac transposable element-derived protein 3-like [Schistocerca cancellata]|uniref:piggyBac transposable element-derived protein 3-like n=1 Tax=Schistocerca cancellata TaxID=274614 RepID=UPI0021195789|nr:piggyBac transposable element-derived protein 3-like [Schistocerca cancellata]
MEPYSGHHFMKQFIRGKPIRYGFKWWWSATSTGYLIKFEPYVGASQRDPQKTLGQSVVEKLCVGYIPLNSRLYIDNYFNSLLLLESFSSHGIKCIGTLRNDRLEKAPMPDIKWNRGSRKKVSISQPSLVQEYIRHMGGVDLFDNLQSLYHIRKRSKKGYWRLIRLCLTGAVVNVWILYRRIVLSVLTSSNIEKPRAVRPRFLSQVQEDIRFDNTGHMIDEQSTQRRCGQCGKCTIFHCLLVSSTICFYHISLTCE